MCIRDSWYIVSDKSSNRIVQFRRDGSDKSYIDNEGGFRSRNNAWSGNPGTEAKIQYANNRWYMVADKNSQRLMQFRLDGADKSYIDKNGSYVGSVYLPKQNSSNEGGEITFASPNGTNLH